MAITTKHQLLAWDLVEGLGDPIHKGIYFRLAKIYDEAFLREILSNVKNACNQGRIKNADRGRYFMGILKKDLGRLNLYTKNNGKSIKNSSRRRSGLKKNGRAGEKSKKS
ncbi:MAG: hypothetical protein AAB789_01860 [Patescibacteria group bacterium]